MAFWNKITNYLGNRQNLRKVILISIAVVLLGGVVLFSSDIQNLFRYPWPSKAWGDEEGTPPGSNVGWNSSERGELPRLLKERSNANLIDVYHEDGSRWLYAIGGVNTIENELERPGWSETGNYRINLIKEVERIELSEDGSIKEDAGWEEAPPMNFGHAEFGLIEHDDYIYVISGDIHMPKVDDEDTEFPLLYSTIERLDLSDTGMNEGGIISFTEGIPDNELITVTTSDPHELSNSDRVTISGTDNYDGCYMVNNITANTFDITATWLGSEAGGFGMLWVENKWEIPALVSGVNFYPEIKIYKDKLHIVGGVYGNPFRGTAFNIYGGYTAKDPLIIGDDIDAWDDLGLGDKPVIGGRDMPLWLKGTGLHDPITGDPNPNNPDPIDLPGMGTIMLPFGIQQTEWGELPPWYPINNFQNLAKLWSEMLLNGAFYTTVSEHYIIDPGPPFTYKTGELGIDYKSSELLKDVWELNKVFKIGHLKILLTYCCTFDGKIYPVIYPPPQGRYGHELVVHRYNDGQEQEDLLVIGGASWSNPYTRHLSYSDWHFTSAYLTFWVIEDGYHPFTEQDMWGEGNENDWWWFDYKFDYRYVGNITYKWDPTPYEGEGILEWEGTNAGSASFRNNGLTTTGNLELPGFYALHKGTKRTGRAFFGMAELDIPPDPDDPDSSASNALIATGGLENCSDTDGTDCPDYYKRDSGDGYFYLEWGIPIDVTNRVEKLENPGYGWIAEAELPPIGHFYNLFSVGIDNYRSLSMNGLENFQDDQWANTHMPEYTSTASPGTFMFDGVTWYTLSGSGSGGGEDDGDSGYDEELRVIRPNGGEKWTIGSEKNVRWVSPGYETGGMVKIELQRYPGGEWELIVAETADNGQYLWYLSKDTIFATRYARIKITEVGGSGLWDVSDGTFEIIYEGQDMFPLGYSAFHDVRTTDQYGVTTVYVYKVGGADGVEDIGDWLWQENWLPHVTNIVEVLGKFTYGGAGIFNPISSEFTLDPDEVPADGMSYSTATVVMKDYYGDIIADRHVLVRADSCLDEYPNASDIIKIDPLYIGDYIDTLTVIEPNGSERMAIGTSRAIIWNNPVDLDEVKIELQIDGGDWEDITGGPILNRRAYKWVVSGEPTTDAKIKISSIDGSISSISSFFTITNVGEGDEYEYPVIRTDENGIARFRLSSRSEIVDDITAWVNASNVPGDMMLRKLGPLPLIFTLDGVPDLQKSTIKADPIKVAGDGIDTSTVTVTLLDHNDLAASGYYVAISSVRNVSAESGIISAFVDIGDGQVEVISMGHGLPDGSVIKIEETTFYNGFHIISNVNINTFEITADWIGTATGKWTVDLVDDIELSDEYSQQPIIDINGQVKFTVRSLTGGHAKITGRYSVLENELDTNYVELVSAAVIEFGGFIKSLIPDHGIQGQWLPSVQAIGQATRWESDNTTVTFIPPTEVSFYWLEGDIESLHLQADGISITELGVWTPNYKNAEVTLTIIEGGGSFWPEGNQEVQVETDSSGRAEFNYQSGDIPVILKIKAEVEDGPSGELWLILEDDKIHPYNLEIFADPPSLASDVQQSTIRAVIYSYVYGEDGVEKKLIEDIVSFSFVSDDNGSLDSPVNSGNGGIPGIARSIYTKDTEVGGVHIFASAIYDGCYLADKVLINKEGNSNITYDLDSLDIKSPTELVIEDIHIEEDAEVGYWMFSVSTSLYINIGNMALYTELVEQHSFLVLSKDPNVGARLIAIHPKIGLRDNNYSVTIIGESTFFLDGYSMVSFTPVNGDDSSGIEFDINDITVSSSTSLTVDLFIKHDAIVGYWNVSVTTGSEVALMPGDFDFLVTDESNYFINLLAKPSTLPRDGESRSVITAIVGYVDPVTGEKELLDNIEVTLDKDDEGILEPLVITTDNGLAESMYTVDSGTENAFVTISAIAEPEDGVIIATWVKIFKEVYPYDVLLTANPTELPLYGDPISSALRVEKLPVGDKVELIFEFNGTPKGHIEPMVTTTTTGVATSTYIAAPEDDRIPETVEIFAWATIPGIGVIRSNTALIQIGRDESKYQLQLIADPDAIPAGGTQTSDIIATLTFDPLYPEPVTGWPLDFEVIQAKPGDYVKDLRVWTQLPDGKAITEFVPGYIAGTVIIRARPLGLGILNEVIVTKTSDAIVDYYLSDISAVPRYVPADGIAFSVVTVTLRNSNYVPLAGKLVKLSTNRTEDIDIIEPDDLGTTDNWGRAIFRVSSSAVGTSEVTAQVDDIVLDTSINFEALGLLISHKLKVTVPFEARDYGNEVWVYLTEPALADPVFIDAKYYKTSRPTNRLEELYAITIWLHTNSDYIMWAKGRNHRARTETFRTGSIGGDDIVIDFIKLLVGDLLPNKRDCENIPPEDDPPTPFHDNAINTLDMGLLFGDYWQNAYPGDIYWDGQINTLDLGYLLKNYGAGATGGPPLPPCPSD